MKKKILYQQWYGVNLLIGVMCVIVCHAYTPYATVICVWDHHCVSLRIENDLNDMEMTHMGSGSGIYHFFKTKILLKKLWRGIEYRFLFVYSLALCKLTDD